MSSFAPVKPSTAIPCNGSPGGDRGTVQITARREVAIQSPAEQVLCPTGIARGRAEALLQHCGNVAFALQALTDGEKIAGVGPSTKNAVRSVLGLPSEMRLAVISMEVENE